VAAIHDLIAQIEDQTLRQRLTEKLARLTKNKKFGLVFEDHLPELMPLYSAKVVRGSLVARKVGPLLDIWRVISVDKGEAYCIQRTTGHQAKIAVDDLVVVRQFGEPIFPALVPVDCVANGPEDAPWHTLIEADIPCPAITGVSLRGAGGLHLHRSAVQHRRP
jgi:adenine-specific DNA-methyltransferase